MRNSLLVKTSQLLSSLDRTRVNSQLLRAASVSGVIQFLNKMFIRKSDAEVLSCESRLQPWLPEMLEFHFHTVDAHVRNKSFQMADGILRRLSIYYAHESESFLNILHKRLKVVDACMSEGEIAVAAAILDDAFRFSRVGSDSEGLVIQKRLLYRDLCRKQNSEELPVH